MTIRIPRWLPIVLGVLALVVVGFFLGRLVVPESTPSGQVFSREAVADEGEPESDAKEMPECSRRAALVALRPLALEGVKALDFFIDPDSGDFIDSIRPHLIDCTDVSGDGRDEMIVSYLYGGFGTAFRIPWIIFDHKSGRWKAAYIDDALVTTQIEVRGNSVRVVEPAYGPDDANCCPSGERTGKVSYAAGEYSYQPDEGTSDRSIVVERDGRDSRVVSVGGFDIWRGDIEDAIEQFGAPSRYFRAGAEFCPTSWSDIGLTIEFYNLGAANPCEAGVVMHFRVEDGAGWYGPGRLEPGMPERAMHRLYPDAEPYSPLGVELDPGERAWVLEERYNVIGEEGYIPTVVAFTDGERVGAVQYFAGVGGD